MSTVLVFNPVADLSAQQTAIDEVTLNWTAATRILTLTNLGAESGNVGGASGGPPLGWVDEAGNLRVRIGAAATGREPPEGVAIFDGGTSATSRASQLFSPLTYGLTINEIDTDTRTMTVDWWGGAFVQSNQDQPKLILHFYDEDMVLISSHDSGFKLPTTEYGNMYWDEYQETPTIPVGTRWIAFELWAHRRNGSNNDASFDDIRYTLEGASALPYVPGYAIYQDGVLIDTAVPNATQFVVPGLALGSYEFKVVPYDSTNFLAADSNVAEITLEDSNPATDELHDIIAFDDERIYGGYLGGKLRGKVVACPGRNASIAKTCC